ncbi:polygalacturonase QRT2-like [Carica papaya]|uniref:polygalacturonase QRT2-like n=1 Tax=Carica papaya TaxID=3649 RepID=UPI000B8CFA6A|nr:polygalacturonase QRT2-like [Carica papaya]
MCLLQSGFGSYQDEQSPVNDYHHPQYQPHDHKGLVMVMRRFSRAHPPQPSPRIVNVDRYGAKANGRDDSQAFKKAWRAACLASNGAVLVVPRNKIYHLKPLIFSGPCKSTLTFKIYGTIKAWVKQSEYRERRHWLRFDNVHNLRVTGGGIINGNGRKWWLNSCKINKKLPCKDAPTAVTFYECSNLIVSNIWFQNSQKMHISFQSCLYVKALNLVVTAPENSPNTDGIHVTGTRNILIKNCLIRTGDDCISIVSGSKNVRATGITCGPGHGISIGSLGADNSEAYVSNVEVTNSKLTGTTNGVRIKTWQGGSGFAKNIIFHNIEMKNVTNPIIIDQNYCDQDDPCPQQASAVKVSNVLYRNIKGTSASKVAINFDCSETVPCQGILLQDVAIASKHEEPTKASCANVILDTRGDVFPYCFNN